MFGFSERIFHALLILSAGLSMLLHPLKATLENQPPVAVSDSYSVHGREFLPVTANDSDPDHEGIRICGFPQLPAHGQVGVAGQTLAAYTPNYGFTGSDSFTYVVCDNAGAESNAALVSLGIHNESPVATGNSYSGHGVIHFSGFLSDDSDADGDQLTLGDSQHEIFVTLPQHGTLAPGAPPDHYLYNPHLGYVGSDSFMYQICDELGGCATATITIEVNNSPPTATDNSYFGSGQIDVSGFFVDDSDPESDQFTLGDGQHEAFPTLPQHGTLYPVSQPDHYLYTPNPEYGGTDSFVYQVCDDLGQCAHATVTLWVIGDGENNGVCDPCGAPAAVGRPINVTNGNMYLQQADYALPGVGAAISVTRTYNSNSQRIGLFGRGWTSEYEESIEPLDSNLVRFNEPDGRAIYLGRVIGATGSLLPLEGDFHGSVALIGSGYAITMTDGSVHQFNSAGKLMALSDRVGNQTTLSYDSGGKLNSVTDSFGRVLSFATNANGNVLAITDTMGAAATYVYNSDRLQAVSYPDNSGFQFGYDGSNRLTSVTDALGNVLESHTYDGLARAITSERQSAVEHYSLNFVSAVETDVTDGLGRVTKFTFDKSKGRNAVTKVERICSCGAAGSQVQSWTYDKKLNVTAKTDALNHLSTFTYDAAGNRLTETDSVGTSTYTYNSRAQVLTATDKLGKVTTNAYDPSGNLLTMIDALNNTTTLTYNGRGQVLTATDARGKAVTFTYDAAGNLAQHKDANNITTYFFYDARGRLTKVRDGLSRNTLYAYDAAGRVSKITHADNSFVSFAYDLAGRRIAVTDERGNATTYAYDGAYRLITVTDPLNHANHFGYDSMSNLTSATDALNRVTDYDYDEFDRLKKAIYPPATNGATRLFLSVTYDSVGNVKQRTDTAGRVTAYAYDNLNRLVSTTDANNQTTSVTYDALSRVTRVTDALNQQYEFAYDALGRQTQITRAGSSMSFAYDAVGNLTQRTDYNGTVAGYSYDNLNRLTTITYPSRTLSYAYDPLGNLTRATNENGSIYMSYDNRYRLSTVSDPFYYGVSYNYDAAGNRTKLSLNYATYATYTYDAANRLTNLKDSANQNFPQTYDAANRLITRSAPNGVTTSYSYDDLNRLTGLTHARGANTLSDNQYLYNDANNLQRWTNTGGTHDYEYDLVDRLTASQNSLEPNEAYSYDGVGNRLSSSLSANYGYQPLNRLVSTDAAAYSYDNNGNLLSRAGKQGEPSFNWNEENQLSEVDLPGGEVVRYKYDALGRRIQRTTSSGSANERYVYDGSDVLLDLNEDWSVATTYLNGPGIDNHLRQTSATSGVSYYLTDHLGSTAALTDASGSIVEERKYDSFGRDLSSAESEIGGEARGPAGLSTGTTSRTRYGYTGRERDADTGLMYYRARWYDAELGRFISEDPIGLGGGINQFAYVSNNPPNRTDPSGLYDIDVHYYLTYYLALATGCFGDWEAREIAKSDQLSDEDQDKGPGVGLKVTGGFRGGGIGADVAQQQRNADFHAFGTPQQNVSRAAALFGAVRQGGGNLMAIGTYLHFIQDSFSHREYAGHTTRGQAWPGGHKVDQTSFAKMTAFDMAMKAFLDLKAFGKMRGCKCDAGPDWGRIRAFIAVGWGQMNPIGLAYETSDDQLRAKIKLLGVPWRSATGR